MGFKDLFIERTEETPSGYVPETSYPTEDIDTQLPEESTTDFIGDVYNENGLSDFSKSIFKVEELAATLPTEMPKDTKRQTVMSIMSTVGLDVDTVIADGQLRVQNLSNAETAVVASLDVDIANSENTIESLKEQIEDLQKDISMKKAQISSIKEAALRETDRINALMRFLKEEQK